MKLKCRPEDFEVEELTNRIPAEGPFALYRLTKRSIGTPEAISTCLQRWQLSRRHVSWGGLKDRHALTQQYVTILHGPRRDLRQESLELRYLGQSPDPFTPADIAANRFRITMRDLQAPEAEWLQTSGAAFLALGVPNYFDDQRFGSVGYSGEFIGAAWCQDNFERALWLAIAEANPHDRPADRHEKELLRTHWNDWPTCRQKLARSSRRSIVVYLCDHPQDYMRALALLPRDLRSLYLAAFQSYLWNSILTRWLQQHWPAAQLQPFRIDRREMTHVERWYYTDWPVTNRDQLATESLPLPSARLRLEPGERADLYTEVLSAQGWALERLKLRYPRDTFFSKGDRQALLVPHEYRCTLAADELYAGRKKAIAEFVLPRGAYATMIIKRLTMELRTVLFGPATDSNTPGNEPDPSEADDLAGDDSDYEELS